MCDSFATLFHCVFVQVLQLDQVQDQATELSVSIMKVRSISLQPN